MTPSPHPHAVSVSGEGGRDHLKALSEKATAGEYRAATFQIYCGSDKVAHTGMGALPPRRSEEAEANAAFIVAAVNYVRDLLANATPPAPTMAPTGAGSDPGPSSSGEHAEGPFSALVDAEWQTLLEKDDRTSPEDYPDMCLVTRTELACAMTEAFVYGTSLPPPPAAGQDLSEAVLDGSTVIKIVETLGFDPTNHHNAARCPYCNPHGWKPAPSLVELVSADLPPPTLPDLEGVKARVDANHRLIRNLRARGNASHGRAPQSETAALCDEAADALTALEAVNAALQALEAKDV